MATISFENHAFAKHIITKLRNKNTNSVTFRKYVKAGLNIMAGSFLKDLPLIETKITTPLVETTGYKLSYNAFIVPILRAGLGLVDPLIELIPTATVFHIGLKRVETKIHLIHQQYYNNTPDTFDENSIIFLVDPMLATGDSARRALDIILSSKPKKIIFIGLIAYDSSLKKLQVEYPNIDFYFLAIDHKLDENKYIIPGLGDAGDRIFNT